MQKKKRSYSWLGEGRKIISGRDGIWSQILKVGLDFNGQRWGEGYSILSKQMHSQSGQESHLTGHCVVATGKLEGYGCEDKCSQVIKWFQMPGIWTLSRSHQSQLETSTDFYLEFIICVALWWHFSASLIKWEEKTNALVQNYPEAGRKDEIRLQSFSATSPAPVHV